MSEKFAQRLSDKHESVEEQIASACELAWGRAADDDEALEALTFVKQHGLAAFCRVLMNSNAFLYVR